MRSKVQVTGSKTGNDSITGIVVDKTLVVRWYGGHGLHLFDISPEGKKGHAGNQGTEIQYRSVGNFANDSLSREEARKEVREWAEWIASGDPAALEFY